MKKITIIALHLGYGGIEKAIASLANMLCDDYEVNIISTYKLYEEPAFFIDSRIDICYLLTDKPNKKELLTALKKANVAGFIKESTKSLKVLRLRKTSMIEAIKQCDSDVIISTRPFHNSLLGKYAKEGIIKIAWEHSHHNNNQSYINEVVSSCDKIDYFISVSKELNNFYTSKIKNSKTICKHISLTLDDFPTELSHLDKKEIISVGRLSKEKGFDSLIDVFKLVTLEKPEWHLNIVGDGLEKSNIEKTIKNNNLEDYVTLHGFKDKAELNKILQNSSIYVMTSLTESFGLVLIEAMSYGIPCLSFDSARGSLEIIDNGINGFTIPNRDKKLMAEKIINLIEDDELRQKMGAKAHEKSMLFSKDIIKKDWINLIENN